MDMVISNTYHTVMLKTIITQLTDRLKGGGAINKARHTAHPLQNEDAGRYAANPLAHPDLLRMDQRELGDLPFEPRCIRSGR